jgi:hypothetical protein
MGSVVADFWGPERPKRPRRPQRPQRPKRSRYQPLSATSVDAIGSCPRPRFGPFGLFGLSRLFCLFVCLHRENEQTNKRTTLVLAECVWRICSCTPIRGFSLVSRSKKKTPARDSCGSVVCERRWIRAKRQS